MTDTPQPEAHPSGLTHIDESGAARMVDVSGKQVGARSATATGRVLLAAEAVAALREGDVPKGDALAIDDPWYGDDASFDRTSAEVVAAADGVVDFVREQLASTA